MPETSHPPSIESTPDMRITGLNRDKTRTTEGSDTVYQVYFELSGTPPEAWRSIFEGEWKVLNPTQPHLWQAASIDGRFLLMHCPLKGIASHLPVLKKAVAATNKSYKQYVQEQATERGRREDVWQQERKAVDNIADSLDFD
jgi:hypothetical protein